MNESILSVVLGAIVAAVILFFNRKDDTNKKEVERLQAELDASKSTYKFEERKKEADASEDKYRDARDDFNSSFGDGSDPK